MKKLFITISFLFLISVMISAEETQAENIQNSQFSGKNPTYASTLSFICPGGGQIYNNSYIKAGTVILADAYFIGMAVYNEDKRQETRKKMLLADNEVIKEYYRNRMNDYYEKRQSDYWWIGITTFLSMADAYVDAHLYNFEKKKKEVELRFSDAKLSLTYRF
ncbi:MAG: hypothetical protein KA886_04300 [Candidatus Cloacimonetes bacterium]|nr:hypothetical protein [Candidatus Cloacimonadota bacterium]HPM01571.1 DUF5683 domain-containing protein [Candidatus Cloacimonadota bacterium]